MRCKIGLTCKPAIMSHAEKRAIASCKYDHNVFVSSDWLNLMVKWCRPLICVTVCHIKLTLRGQPLVSAVDKTGVSNNERRFPQFVKRRHFDGACITTFETWLTHCLQAALGEKNSSKAIPFWFWHFLCWRGEQSFLTCNNRDSRQWIW